MPLGNNCWMNKSINLYKRYRFPPEIIQYSVWLYHRFNLSHRDIEDLMAERGIVVSYESIRLWCNKFGPQYAKRLKHRHQVLAIHFLLMKYLWRAVNHGKILGHPLVVCKRLPTD
jgi:putative transposase